MASRILIEPPSDILIRGQTQSVPVTLFLDKPLKVRGIHGDFSGVEETKAVYTTTTTDSKGNVKTQTHTAVEHEPIVTKAELLAGNRRLGFFGNVSDALSTMFGGGKHDLLDPGEHRFEVELSIPGDAPPTHTGEKSRVFYELSIRVDVPLAFDVKANQSFRVEPMIDSEFKTNPVRTSYPDDDGRGLIDRIFAPDLKIEMALIADKYRLGEVIEGIFVIETPKPLNCDGMLVRMIGIENSEAHGHTDVHTYKSDTVRLNIPGIISQTHTQEFSLNAETEAPLSASGKRFSIKWFVEIQLDVPWAKDPKIRAPIVLLSRL